MSYPFEQTIVSNQIAPRNAVYRVRSPIAGQIREYRVTVAAANNNGATVFTLKRADASTIATLVIPAGETIAALFTPIAAVAKWEVITVDLTLVPPGGAAGPIDFLIDVEEDVTTVGLAPTAFINQFYTGALNRLPSGAEQAAALAPLDASGQIGDTYGLRAAAKALGATLFTSPEYIARGRTDAQFVSDLYSAYLGRAADPISLDYWLAQIGIQGRDNVRTAIAESVEFANNRVAKLYPGILETADASFKRLTVTKQTANLANNGVENGTLPLGKAFALFKLTLSHPARVRLYSTAAARAADAARGFDVPLTPGSQHGLITDLNLTPGTGLSWVMSPQALGANSEGVATVDIPYAIENRSGGPAQITATFTVIRMEA